VDLALLGLMALGNVEELIPMVAPPLFILTVVILSLYTGWSKAFRRSGQPAQARRSLKLSFLAGLIVAVVAWLPFALWVLGAIPGYSAALILAIIGVVATMTWARGRLPKPSRPSPQAA
jgi:Flp pilus assembly protein TadB